MLFETVSHEAPAGEPWNAERIRAGIRAIVADAEAAFDDGWPDHPQDGEADRLRTLYMGGAGSWMRSAACAPRPRRVAARLRAVPRALGGGAARLRRRGRRAQSLDGRSGCAAGAAASVADGGQPEAARRADRRECRGRAAGADVGQPGHDPRGPRARARRRRRRRLAARAARARRALDAGPVRPPAAARRACARLRRLRARARRR